MQKCHSTSILFLTEAFAFINIPKNKSWQTFSRKGQIASHLGFVSPAGSDVTYQLCYLSAKVAIDKTSMNGHSNVPIKHKDKQWTRTDPRAIDCLL